MYNCSFAFFALEDTVTRMFWDPFFPLELKTILIEPDEPGANGSSFHFGTVHPQPAFIS